MYAANGGKNQQRFLYAGSDTLDEVAWYKDNADGEMHPVAQKLPDTLGLYDMCGNVREITRAVDSDSWYYECDGVYACGASAYDNEEECRLEWLYTEEQSHDWQGDGFTGFRICKTCPQEAAE